MAAKLLKHMGVSKELAESVRKHIQGKGEDRRRAEKKRKIEAHLDHQRHQMEEKEERKKIRMMLHKKRMEAQRRHKKRENSAKKASKNLEDSEKSSNFASVAPGQAPKPQRNPVSKKKNKKNKQTKPREV